MRQYAGLGKHLLKKQGAAAVNPCDGPGLESTEWLGSWVKFGVVVRVPRILRACVTDTAGERWGPAIGFLRLGQRSSKGHDAEQHPILMVAVVAKATT